MTKMKTIHVELGDSFKEDYVLLETKAPAAYDCGDAIEIRGGKYMRYVLVPQRACEWQLSRNASGLHQTTVIEDFSMLKVAADTLYRRMAGKTRI